MPRRMTAAQIHEESHPKYGRILFWIDETMSSREAKRNDWPGKPINQVPLACKSELDAAIRDGLVEIVERPRVTDPTRKATFIRRVGA